MWIISFLSLLDPLAGLTFIEFESIAKSIEWVGDKIVRIDLRGIHSRSARPKVDILLISSHIWVILILKRYQSHILWYKCCSFQAELPLSWRSPSIWSFPWKFAIIFSKYTCIWLFWSWYWCWLLFSEAYGTFLSLVIKPQMVRARLDMLHFHLVRAHRRYSYTVELNQSMQTHLSFMFISLHIDHKE